MTRRTLIGAGHEDVRGRVVVAGAGFAGLEAARALERAAGPGLEVRLLDRRNSLLFAPLLAEAASGTVNPAHVAVPLRGFFARVAVNQGEITEIDLNRGELRLAAGEGLVPSEHVIAFDHLVLALGSRTSFFGLPGLAEHALTLGSLGDALRIRNRVLLALEQAELETDPGLRSELLTFVVGGGAYTGVELAGCLSDFLRHAVASYPRLAADDVRVVLAERRERLLPELGARLGAFAERELRAKGVEVLLEAPVACAGEDHVSLEDGTRIATRTVVWAAGIEPPDLAGSSDLPRDERGWIVTDDALRVPGRRGVSAVGDCAANPDGRGRTSPPTAQHAVRQGRAVAGNVLRALRGEEPSLFRYEARGTLIGLGHRSGLAEVRGRVVRGLPAWALWRAFYLRELPTLARSARVGLDWAVNAFTGPDLAEVPLEPRTAPFAAAT